MIGSFQRTPQFLLQHPTSFDALCGLLPFPFCLQTPGASEGISASEQLSAPSKGPPGICGGGSSAGSFSSPSSGSGSPFLNEGWAGAGTAAAASSPSCGCGCLQCPLVTCSRCSHNRMRGGGRMPQGVQALSSSFLL